MHRHFFSLEKGGIFLPSAQLQLKGLCALKTWLILATEHKNLYNFLKV